VTVRHLTDWVIYLGAVAGALTALAILLRFLVLKPLKRWITEQIKQPLDKVHTEFRPNHGGSMKDALNRIERELQEQSVKLTDHLINDHLRKR
jgi:Flp pilus assembly protein TadB